MRSNACPTAEGERARKKQQRVPTRRKRVTSIVRRRFQSMLLRSSSRADSQPGDGSARAPIAIPGLLTGRHLSRAGRKSAKEERGGGARGRRSFEIFVSREGESRAEGNVALVTFPRLLLSRIDSGVNARESSKGSHRVSLPFWRSLARAERTSLVFSRQSDLDSERENREGEKAEAKRARVPLSLRARSFRLLLASLQPSFRNPPRPSSPNLTLESPTPTKH